MLSPNQAEEVISAFPDADITLIDEIIYFDGWTSYEECGGYLIFKGIDGSIQFAEYGTSVFSSEPNAFCSRDVTAEEAERLILEMQRAIRESDRLFDN